MIFMYHNVVPEEASKGHGYQSITLRENQFVKQVRILKRIFKFVSLEDYLTEWRRSGRQPLSKAVLTIDDGTWSTFEYGVKHLVNMKVPSVVFTNSCHIDKGPLIWGGYLNALCLEDTYSEIELDGNLYKLTSKDEKFSARKALVAKARKTDNPHETVMTWSEKYPLEPEVLKYYQGVSSEQLTWSGENEYVEIAMHTHTHPFLTSLDKKGQHDEIVRNKTELESRVGKTMRYFAYPSGDYNLDTLSLMRDMGLEAACAVHMGGKNDNLIYELPRLGIYSPSVLKVLITSVLHRWKYKSLKFV